MTTDWAALQKYSCFPKANKKGGGEEWQYGHIKE